MDTFHYRRWFTVLDKAPIEEAVLVAERTGRFAYHGPPEHFFGQGPFAVSDAAAVQWAVAVYAVVVQVLQRRRDRRSPDALQGAADDLLDQIIVWAQQKQPAQTCSLEVFETRVRDALSTQSGPTVPATRSEPPAIDNRGAVSVQYVAEHLHVIPKTVYRLVKRGTLPATRVGRAIRIARADLDRLIATNRYLR